MTGKNKCYADVLWTKAIVIVLKTKVRKLVLILIPSSWKHLLSFMTLSDSLHIVKSYFLEVTEYNYALAGSLARRGKYLLSWI